MRSLRTDARRRGQHAAPLSSARGSERVAGGHRVTVLRDRRHARGRRQTPRRRTCGRSCPRGRRAGREGRRQRARNREHGHLAVGQARGAVVDTVTSTAAVTNDRRPGRPATEPQRRRRGQFCTTTSPRHRLHAGHRAALRQAVARARAARCEIAALGKRLHTSAPDIDPFRQPRVSGLPETQTCSAGGTRRARLWRALRWRGTVVGWG